MRIDSPLAAMRQGLTYLPEDRKGKGLHIDLGLAENLTLMTLARYAHPWLDKGAEQAALTRAINDFGIKAGSHSARARMMSGAISRNWPSPSSCTRTPGSSSSTSPPGGGCRCQA